MNNGRSNTVIFNQVQKSIISPLPQSSGAFHIVIPPYKFRSSIDHRQAGPISSNLTVNNQSNTEVRVIPNALSTLIPI